MDRKGSVRTAVCTIVSRNYLHYARTLMDSVRAAQPDWEPYVLLVDRVDGAFDPAGERYTLVEAEELPLPDPKKFLFRYTVLEANTAVKPWLLEWLFEKRGAQRVVYLDPDIFVYRPLEEITAALDRGNWMVLTPHLTGELDARKPSEEDILRAGCYNLGFIALARHAHLTPFLHWWQRKLEFNCRVAIDEGLFVDQKWIDLVPGRFDGVAVVRDPGYNVAYWNLPHREVTRRGEQFFVNGRPLAFYHFSGLNPLDPRPVSKHQDRFRLDTIGEAAELIRAYCKAVLDNGQQTFVKMPYAYGFFRDGTRIPDMVRRFYRSSRTAQERAGDDPFAADHAHLNDPWGSTVRPLVTNLMRFIWEARRDLRDGLPDIDRAHRNAYIENFLLHSAKEEKLTERFIEPVRKSWLTVGRSQFYLLRRHPALRVLREMMRPAESLLPVSMRKRVKNRVKRLLGGHVGGEENGAGADGGFGLNIVGYVRSEHGVGESARRCAQAADAAGLAFSLYDFNVNNNSRTSDNSWAHKISETNPHWFNVFHINADQMPLAHTTLGKEFFQGHYNIGFWHWELPEFPDIWRGGFNGLDEIWVPSRFVQDAVCRKAPRSVQRIPHAISCAITPGARRSDFGLPEGRFLFLTMYDTFSMQMRKNPRAVVVAFRRAFPNPEEVGLVIKVNNAASQAQEVAALRAELEAIPGAVVLDQTLSRQDVYDLEGLCDCFVSLHRSEGFGLGLAESMCLGKPVIGTDWSSNTDFMNADNSCPVRYRLVKLERDYGPYHKGQLWADPDIEHAAWYMRQLVDDAAWRRRIAAQGQHTITTEYAPATVGRLIRERMGVIARLHGMPLPTAETPPQRLAA